VAHQAELSLDNVSLLDKKLLFAAFLLIIHWKICQENLVNLKILKNKKL
jgi:hypothetical protein